MKYFAYDVETPNTKNNSVCAVGWVLLDEQNEIDRGYSLIDPQADFSHFNTKVHGIKASDVAGAPTFPDYWQNTLSQVMDSAIVLAHSAGFDMSVTAKALAIAGIEAPRIKFIDTIDLFRALMPAQSYKLPDIAHVFGFEYQAHNAGEDAAALVKVLIALKEKLGLISISAIVEQAGVKAQTMKAAQIEQPTKLSPYERHKALVASIIENAKSKNIDLSYIHFGFHGNPDEPLIERTGGLDLIVESLGGIYHNNQSGKLDYYVCFTDEKTASLEKAQRLAQEPKNHIQIIDGDAFFDIIGYRTNTPNYAGPASIRERKQHEREAALRAAEEAEAQKAAKAAAMAEKKAAKANKSEPVKPVGRTVIQMDKEGNFVASFPSVTIAAASLGISTKVIHDAANGKQKTAGGFCWKFEDQ